MSEMKWTLPRSYSLRLRASNFSLQRVQSYLPVVHALSSQHVSHMSACKALLGAEEDRYDRSLQA